MPSKEEIDLAYEKMECWLAGYSEKTVKDAIRHGLKAVEESRSSKSQDVNDFLQAAQPLMLWLKENANKDMQVVVTTDSVKIRNVLNDELLEAENNLELANETITLVKEALTEGIFLTNFSKLNSPKLQMLGKILGFNIPK